MWKFVTGAAPPPVKKIKTQTEQEKRDRDRQYDKNKRERAFQNSWIEKYPWLEEVEKKLYCKVCKHYEKYGSYVTGCTAYKHDSIKKHDESQGHKNNLAKHKVKSSSASAICESEAYKCQDMLTQSLKKKVSLMIKSAHYLAKNGRPYSDFKALCELDEAKGLEIGNNYRNDKHAAEFVRCIAEAQRQKIVAKFSSCLFFSIISDGATDSSHQEAEILYIKFCINGEIYTFFVGLKNVPKADSDHISRAIIELLDRLFNKTWMNKLVGTGTDGASVMLGANNGVVQKLKVYVDRFFIFVVHCSAHRLELAYKASCKELKLFKMVDTLLLNIYYFYRNSPLNRANLKAAFLTYGRVPLMPTRVGGTRWVAHIKRGLKNLLGGYGPIMTHLKQMQNPDDRASKGESGAKARNFIQNLAKKDVIYFMHLLYDIVDCLSKVSLEFQGCTATISSINSEIEAAKSVLESYKTSNGPKMTEIDMKGSFDGYDLSGNTNSFTSTRNKLLSNLIKQLDNRFESKRNVLAATWIVKLAMYPSKLEDQPEFGNEDIRTLIEEFRPALESAGINTSELQPEWIRFKSLLYNSLANVRASNWIEVNNRLQSKCSGILALIDLVQSLPCSSAEAERGFSLMKITKTDWRSSLKDAHLTDLMTVNLETPDVTEFDPEEAYRVWNSSCIRRPQKDKGVTIPVQQPVLMREEVQEFDDAAVAGQMRLAELDKSSDYESEEEGQVLGPEEAFAELKKLVD